MKFAFKLFGGGIVCAGVGIWWIIDGIEDGQMNQLIGGMLWKGPLLAVAGVAASVMGFRMMSAIARTESNQITAPPPASETAEQKNK